MLGNSLQSAGRRFLRTFAFALAQAVLFGSAIGLLVYFRPTRAMLHDEERLPIHYWLGEKLERLERGFYDWRIRELGRASTRSERAVVVAIDDETIARARQAERAELAMDPWPRELLGGMVDQVMVEGGELVLIDLGFPGLSPRACGTIDPAKLAREGEPPPASSGPTGRCNDDQIFRTLLDKWPGQTVLGFDWGGAQVASAGELRTTLLQVGLRQDEDHAGELVQRILAQRLPAFVIPQAPPGKGFEIWAGVENEDEARTRAQEWGLKWPIHVRDFTPRDQQHQVTPLHYFVHLAEIEVKGIDPAALPTVRVVEHPVTPLLSRKSLYGAANARPDGDGVLRAFPHLVQLQDARDDRRHVLPSMPLAAAMRLAGTREVRYHDRRLWIGEKYSIPVDASGYAQLRFDSDEVTSPERGSLKRSVRAWQLLVNLSDRMKGVPQHYRHDLDGKVVVLADTTEESGRLQTTPIGKASSGAVIGQALVNVLGSDGITRARVRTDLFLTVALAFAGAFLALTFGRAFRSAAGVVFYLLALGATVGAFVYGARHLFLERQLWVAMAGPLIAMHITFALATLHALRTELEVKTFVTSVLGRYVSTEVVHQVMRNVAQIRPERLEVTVYFSDIEGFTRFAEKLSPEEMVRLLNEYLSEMTEVVRRNLGYVDKYIGDAVMAFWGGLPRHEHHALLACESALEMREALAKRQADWEKRYGYRVVFRAGINTGEVVLGDMGSDLKSNFTVMGDAVDFAARLEPTNKQYGTYLLAGERTAQLARTDYVFREVDLIRVRDRTVPARIYELVCRTAELTPSLSAQLSKYEEALTHYRARRFHEAAEAFGNCVSQWQDPVAKVYLERAERLLQAPPGQDWDGVFERRQPRA